MGKVKERVPFSQDMPHCWPSRQKLCTLVTHEVQHAVRRWDHWHEQLPSLQTAVFFISLWQKAPIDKAQQATGHSPCCFILSSPVLAWAGPSAAERHWDDAMFSHGRRRFSGRSLRQHLSKGLDHYFKDSFCACPPCRRAQGSQDLLTFSSSSWWAVVTSPALSSETCPAGTSLPLTPQILQLPSFSSSSPLWHWSETPMGHTVGNEIKAGICKDDAFLESLIGQMLIWGSGHLSIQALPVQQVIAKRERVTIWDCNPKTQGHKKLQWKNGRWCSWLI